MNLLIEIEAYKREISKARYKELADKLVNELVWLGFKNIKITIKKKEK